MNMRDKSTVDSYSKEKRNSQTRGSIEKLN